MIKESFPYINTNLVFNAKKHEYKINGIKIPSVTGWVSSFYESFNIHEVAKKVSENVNSEYYGMNVKDIQKKWQSSAVTGTKKHKEIENWINGKVEDCNESKFFRSLNIKPENTWSEIKLSSEKFMLAGTADLITRVDNKFIIWDVKTSKKIDQEKLTKFYYQILTYCVLLAQMCDNTYEVIPGGVISIRSKNNISDDNKIVEFLEPELFKLEEEFDWNYFNFMLTKRFKECQNIS